MTFVKKYIKKNNLINLLIFLISELICFSITSIHLIEYDKQKIYLPAITIVQLFYFIPILLVSFHFFLSQKTEKKLLTYATFFLICYSIILHFFIKQLAMLFTSSSGILNFVQYSAKIYLIALPLTAFEIWGIQKGIFEKTWLVLLFKIILFIFITFIFKFLFGLKGILYSWSLCEFFYIFLFFIKNKACIRS